MSIAAASALFCGCVVLSIASSLVFARKLDGVSQRLGVSEGLHGLLTALGADAPEISAAVAALLAGRQDLGVGVVLGSNVFNLAGLLGLSAVVAGTIRIHRHGLVLNAAAALGVTGIGAALILGGLGPGLSLVLLLVVFVPYVVLLSLRPARIREVSHKRVLGRSIAAAVLEEAHDARHDEVPPPASIVDAPTLLLALGAIIGASVGMVEAATSLGDRWGVSDAIAGMLVIASLTSLPNVITAVRLALHRRGSAVVSESLNSNTLNLLAGVAVPALFFTLGSASGHVTFAVWALLGMTALVVLLAYVGEGLGRREGALIIALYVVFATIVAVR